MSGSACSLNMGRVRTLEMNVKIPLPLVKANIQVIDSFFLPTLVFLLLFSASVCPGFN